MRLPAMLVSIAAWAFWVRTQTSSYMTGLWKNQQNQRVTLFVHGIRNQAFLTSKGAGHYKLNPKSLLTSNS